MLSGDALIVLAFETVALAAARVPSRVAPLSLILARSVGMPNGIAAGQAWESEPCVDLARYHKAKTGALFAAATMAGAKAAGAVGEPWRMLGDRLGEAFQVAAEARAYLAAKGIDITGVQQTKTRTALRFFQKQLQAATPA